MTLRLVTAAIFWLLIITAIFYALGGSAGLIGLALGFAVLLIVWQAVWITASWVTTGDPRWWR